MNSVDQIGPTLSALIAETQRRLDAARRTVSKNVVTVQPGLEVAWDDVCPGLLWGRVVRLDAVMAAPKANGEPCGVSFWDVQLGLGVVRCVATVDRKGNPPTFAEVSANGEEMLLDIATTRDAILTIHNPRVMTWQPLGPLGGGAGGEWITSHRIMACAPSEV